MFTIKCPYGRVGDRLWLRETWRPLSGPDRCVTCGARWPKSFCIGGCGDYHPDVAYRADGDLPGKWKPAIHMFRWASRITLEITGVRVERLQNISEEDAQAEGVQVGDYVGAGYGTHRSAFHALWDSINGERPGCTWGDSPWVWVIEFEEVAG